MSEVLNEYKKLQALSMVPDEPCLYKVMLSDSTGDYIKIGYSSNFPKRRYEFEKLGFKVRIIQKMKGNESDLMTYEAYIHAYLMTKRKTHPMKFPGSGELYNTTGIPGLKKIINTLKR
ncbi:hypothetical protein [Marinilabilia salmonicolor]|uniref:hypothetical protein n=1 Tax=Marinilabilia salmonicolor TaxID=989 RepID=UPI00029AD777|nr:hypothetical protein [Marinilabilia salmonicolor]